MTLPRDFEEFERVTEGLLRSLPDVEPEKNFQDSLGTRLWSECKKRGSNRRSIKGNLVRLGVVAAVLLLVLAGLPAVFTPQQEDHSTLGPLFVSLAQANHSMIRDITLGSWTDSKRQVEFKFGGAFPAAEKEGVVLRYKDGQLTEEQALSMALRMGIQNPQVSGDRGYLHIYGEGSLTVWLNQGAWLYQRGGEPVTGDMVEGIDAETIAMDWLAAAELMPAGNFTVSRQEEEQQSTVITLRPVTAPGGLPVIGSPPEIRVVVNTDGNVAMAYGCWYTDEETVKVRLREYSEALAALQSGEGSFEAANYDHMTPGVAEIQRVETAYHLAYALVPVAVFQGQYTPENAAPQEFTAYVSLLQKIERQNAGNFRLDTVLPAVPASMPIVSERENEMTAAQLPVLALFFGITGPQGEDGSFRGSEGELSPATWDGGWLYRSEYTLPFAGNKKLDRALLIDAARQSISQLPLMAGEVGEPEILEPPDTEEYSYIIFPLLYSGHPVVDLEGSGYRSYVAVQVGPAGELLSVYCSRPMQVAEKKQPLISPEEAWQQLLANRSKIHVDGFFGTMPGDQFVVESSRVNAVKLAYLPRYPELSRNEDYDLCYVFEGEGHIAGRSIQFRAFVNAVVPDGE
jgi:hypothetical protein